MGAGLLGLALLAVCHVAAAQGYREPRDVAMKVTYMPETCRGKAKDGDTLTMLYEGMFLDGRVFDSNIKKHKGFEFVLGRGKAIKGWDIGLQGICIGEKRQLVIPSRFAYGPNGQGKIPGGATLAFNVELVRLKPGPSVYKLLGRASKAAAPALLAFGLCAYLFLLGVRTKPKAE